MIDSFQEEVGQRARGQVPHVHVADPDRVVLVEVVVLVRLVELHLQPDLLVLAVYLERLHTALQRRLRLVLLPHHEVLLLRRVLQVVLE